MGLKLKGFGLGLHHVFELTLYKYDNIFYYNFHGKQCLEVW